jgi:hypothetical protein
VDDVPDGYARRIVDEEGSGDQLRQHEQVRVPLKKGMPSLRALVAEGTSKPAAACIQISDCQLRPDGRAAERRRTWICMVASPCAQSGMDHGWRTPRTRASLESGSRHSDAVLS